MERHLHKKKSFVFLGELVSVIDGDQKPNFY